MRAWPLGLILLLSSELAAQDQYGGIARREAASALLVLAVEQGIASLPPTNGQSFSYEYDPRLQVFSRSDWLGPVSFRTPETIGSGKANLRTSLSYFGLSERLGPITYSGAYEDGTKIGFTKFGLQVDADVGVFGLAATYGLTDTWDSIVNVPVVLVSRTASHSFLVDPSRPQDVAGAGSREQLEEFIENSTLVFVEQPFRRFHSTQVGLGRVSAGVIGKILSTSVVDAAISAEAFFASPNEHEFAGSDSYAILPRGILSIRPSVGSCVYFDAGYAYDFSEEELSRFTWSLGSAIFFEDATLDFGFGGSLFQAPIRWTPTVARSEAPGSRPIIYTAVEENTLGTAFVDFRMGLKIFLTDWFVLSGSTSLPMNDEGFRPDALGTIAAEAYF
jgi:hypothetical protein